MSWASDESTLSYDGPFSTAAESHVFVLGLGFGSLVAESGLNTALLALLVVVSHSEKPIAEISTEPHYFVMGSVSGWSYANGS